MIIFIMIIFVMIFTLIFVSKFKTNHNYSATLLLSSSLFVVLCL